MRMPAPTWQQVMARRFAPRALADQPRACPAISEAFARHDVMFAEVGIWNNMLDPDPANTAANVDANARGLALADEVGARCCVNIGGSFNPSVGTAPIHKNLSQEAFDLTVQNVRQILDAVGQAGLLHPGDDALGDP